MTATTDSRKTLRLGVFIPADCQLLDMACVDVLGSMSHEYLFQLERLGMAPAPIVDLAPSVHISCASNPPQHPSTYSSDPMPVLT